jgi:NADH-quinone oxidoreductase subunit N
VNAVVALAYYLRVIALLYTRPAPVGIHFADLPAAPAAAPAATPAAEESAAAPAAAGTLTAVVDPDLLEAATHPRMAVPRTVAAAIAVAAAITIVLGFAPQWIFDALLG